MNEVIERLEKIEMLMRISGKSALDINECVAYTGISKTYLRHLTAGHVIPHYKKCGRLFFKKSELDEWMLQNRVPTDAEINELANKLY